LERRGEHARESRGAPPETEASPDSMDLVKVILLGAPAVGKTSIIQVGYVTQYEKHNSRWKTSREGSKLIWKDNIKMDLKQMGVSEYRPNCVGS